MSRLKHDALIYGTDSDLLSTVVPFLRSGAELGEGLVIASHQRNRELIAGELGQHAADAVFVPSEEVYPSLAGAALAYHTVLNDLASKGFENVRAIGEIPYNDPDDPDWMRWEPIAHAVFENEPLHVICPYDARRLPAKMLDHAMRTHPYLQGHKETAESPIFVEPLENLRRLPAQRVLPPGRTPELSLNVDASSASESRQMLSGWFGSMLNEQRASEALIAIFELITNGLRHGDGRSEVTAWSTPAELICSVWNPGPRFDDPLAGFRPPRNPSSGGMGLWIARQFSDNLEISPRESGTSVTVTFGR